MYTIEKNAWLLDMQYHAATDVGMLGKMCRAAPCLCTLLTSGSSCLCFVGLCAGHPYIHLISFEIFYWLVCALFK